MPDPFRLRVMKALSAQLKTVSPANGYEFDVSDYVDAAGRPSERVFRGRTQFGDNDPLPMLSVLEDPRPPAPLDGGASGHSASLFRVMIMGFVPDDMMHPLDPAYRLSAEAMKALIQVKKDRFNLLGFGHRAPAVIDMVIEPAVHRPPDGDQNDVAFFMFGVRLQLAEMLDDPYA